MPSDPQSYGFRKTEDRDGYMSWTNGTVIVDVARAGGTRNKWNTVLYDEDMRDTFVAEGVSKSAAIETAMSLMRDRSMESAAYGEFGPL